MLVVGYGVCLIYLNQELESSHDFVIYGELHLALITTYYRQLVIQDTLDIPWVFNVYTSDDNYY